jgi:hypothetical protein
VLAQSRAWTGRTTGAGGGGELAVADAATEGAPGATGDAGAVCGGDAVAVGVVGGCGGKVVGGRFSIELLAEGGAGGVSGAIVVCATAIVLNDTQAVKAERTRIE